MCFAFLPLRRLFALCTFLLRKAHECRQQYWCRPYWFPFIIIVWQTTCKQQQTSFPTLDWFYVYALLKFSGEFMIEIGNFWLAFMRRAYAAISEYEISRFRFVHNVIVVLKTFCCSTSHSANKSVLWNWETLYMLLSRDETRWHINHWKYLIFIARGISIISDSLVNI